METPGPERSLTTDGARAARGGASGQSTLNIEQLGWAIACLLLVLSSLESGSNALVIPAGEWASAAFLLSGLVGIFYCLRSAKAPPRAFQLFILIGLGFTVLAKAAATYFIDPSYGTDAVAFDQYAANLVAHGHNPYTASMAPALEMFHVSHHFWTFFLNGDFQSLLSYPAGSFLPYVPLLALGVATQAGPLIDLLAWFVGVVLLWALLPRRYKWVAGVVLGASVYTDYIVGGVTDALFLPPLVLALWRWDRFADKREPSVARWIGPLMLGLAMTVKQTPWLLLPFLTVGVALEASARDNRGRTTALRYLVLATGTFALVNSPFIVASPGAWARDVLAPLTSPAIPDGPGLVSLAVTSHLGGGRLAMFSLAAAALLALCFVAFTVSYPRLKQSWPAFIAIVFFFPTRSLGNYMVMMAPALLLAAVSVQAAPAPARNLLRMRWQQTALAAGALVFVTLIAIAIGSPSPLGLKVIGLRTTGQLSTVAEVYVAVQNRTGRMLSPRFTVNDSHASAFWYVLHGQPGAPNAVPPHQTRSFALRAPDTQSMPHVSQDITVEAFTRDPDAVSTSDRLRFSQEIVYLTPGSFDRPVPTGQRLHLVAQLHNRFGKPVRRAGVSLELGQIVYGPAGPVAAASSIDSGPLGRASARARTDALGRAAFTVIGEQAQDSPVFYQAWVDDPLRGPSGYSTPVSVQYYGR